MEKDGNYDDLVQHFQWSCYSYSTTTEIDFQINHKTSVLKQLQRPDRIEWVNRKICTQINSMIHTQIPTSNTKHFATILYKDSSAV